MALEPMQWCHCHNWITFIVSNGSPLVAIEIICTIVAISTTVDNDNPLVRVNGTIVTIGAIAFKLRS